MFFHFRVFVYSLFFFVALRIISKKEVADWLSVLVSGNFFFLLLAVLVWVFLVSAVALKIGKRWNMLPIPATMGLSSISLLFFIDSDKKRFVFVLLSAIIYYFCLLGLYRLRYCQKDQTARGIIAAVAMAVIFIFYAAAYGIYLNFSISLWFAMLMFLIPTILITYQYLRLLGENNQEVWLYSLIIGLSMAEISWVLSFWPFGYLTTGVVMLIFYYLVWDLASCYFLKIVSKKRMVTDIVFFGILATIVLVSSKWLPVV